MSLPLTKLAEWFGLEGRVALVTGGGASGGIGHAVALALAHAGADVLVSDIDDAGASETAREVQGLGRRAVSIRADLGQPDDVLAMMAAQDHEFARADILSTTSVSATAPARKRCRSRIGGRLSASTWTAPSSRPARPAGA